MAEISGRFADRRHRIQVLRGQIDWDTALLAVGQAALIGLVDVAVMPAILVAVVVVGGIYGGVFTPTEGAAVGAIAMLVIGVAGARWAGATLSSPMPRQTAETSGMIFIILLGAEVFGAFLALSRLPTVAAK